MSDPRPDTGSTLLDHAIESLHAASSDAGAPPDFLLRRTAAAMFAEQLDDAQARGRWAMRIAAIIVLGVCAAATAIVIHQRSQLANVRTAPIPPTPAGETNGEHPQVIPVLDLSPESAPAQPPVSASSEVMLTGHVYFNGHRPRRRQIDLTGYPLAIASMPGPIYDESLVVNRDGTLANVVISVTGLLPADHTYPSPPPVVMDLRYCTFTPHVVAAVIGQKMILRDSDRIPHLTHAVNSATAVAFNSPAPGVGTRTVEPFPATDTFELRSDLYPWMHAWVRVLENPFFDVTRTDGSFNIKDLPPGTYTLHAWHEALGELEKEITVTGGEPAVIDFTFDAK
jgi:hypothetical protein